MLCIRFNADLSPCVFQQGLVRIEAKSCDLADIDAFKKIRGLQYPDRSWVPSSDGMHRVDFSLLSEDEVKRFAQGTDAFISSRITSISGIRFESESGDPIEFMALDEKRKVEAVVSIKEAIDEFSVWCVSYIMGAKKKSGHMELVERVLESEPVP